MNLKFEHNVWCSIHMWRQLFCKDIIINKLYGLTAKNICKVIYQSVKFINIYLAILINFQHINICSYCQIIQCIITRICHGFVVRCWMAPFLWCIACSHLQNVFELGAYHNLLCYQDVINIFIIVNWYPNMFTILSDIRVTNIVIWLFYLRSKWS